MNFRNLSFLAAYACISLLFCYCSRTSDNLGVDSELKEIILKANIESPQTRTNYDEEGRIVWGDSEKIAVKSGNIYAELMLTSGSGMSNAIFKGQINKDAVETYALYPYQDYFSQSVEEDKCLTYILPSEYEYCPPGKATIPMYAHIADINAGQAVFHPLSAVLRCSVERLPAGTSSLTIVSDQKICGKVSLDLSSESEQYIKSPDGGQCVTYYLKEALVKDTTLTIDVPLPVGKYKAFAVDIRDEEGKIIKTISTLFDVTAEPGVFRSISFDCNSLEAVKLPTSGLPTIIINIPGGEPVYTKSFWFDGASFSIRNADGSFGAFGTTSIKGRGNSTWLYPKKPYALKLDQKTDLLGMPKHKRWVLLANWGDRTSMRNAVSFEIAQKCKGMGWTPHGNFVELFMNGKHLGYYYLCEQIKVDKNRVNIAKIDPQATEGEEISGGYVMEVDQYYDEKYRFKSSIINLPWMFKDPDEVNDSQFKYMKEYVNNMEISLFTDSLFVARKFERYMDLESFCDYWLAMELAMNIEVSNNRSIFFNKDVNGKIKAGPVWDFDFKTFTPENSERFVLKESVYYGQLFRDSTFRALVKERWLTIKPALSNIPTFIDSTKAYLSVADSVNHAMWPIYLRDNGDESLSFDDAVDRMKQAFIEKMNFIDSQISAF